MYYKARVNEKIVSCFPDDSVKIGPSFILSSWTEVSCAHAQRALSLHFSNLHQHNYYIQQILLPETSLCRLVPGYGGCAPREPARKSNQGST